MSYQETPAWLAAERRRRQLADLQARLDAEEPGRPPNDVEWRAIRTRAAADLVARQPAYERHYFTAPLDPDTLQLG